MADFTFGDVLGSLGNRISNGISDRFQQVSNTFDNPIEAFQNRIGVTTSTNQTETTPELNTTGLNAPKLETGTGPTQIPSGPIYPQAAPAPQMNLPVMKPAVPQDYNASIAQQESGGNANIGYHDKNKSSAFGPYGMTQGAYQDARRINPSLPADITQANPQQLTEAQNAYTQQNTKYLQAYGIEPTPQNLQAAHFLGAKGLSDYLKNGKISPAAAAANGGEEKVREIVNARLGGQAAPASGAVQPQAQPTRPYDMGEMAGVDQAVAQQAAANAGLPQIPQAQQNAAMEAEMQRQRHYEDLNSGDPKRLMALTENPDKSISSAAAGQLADIFKDKKLQDYAQNHVEGLLARGQIPDPNRQKGEEGSYVKAYLFNRLGLTDLARQEQEKIAGTGVKFMPVNLPGGEQYSVKYNKDTGEVISAKDVNNNPVTDSQKLGQIAAQAMTASQVGHAGATRVRDSSGKEWSVVPTAQGSIFYDNANVRGTPTGKTVPIQGGTDIELQGLLQAQKNQGRLDLLNKELQTRLDYIPAQQHNTFISKFNAENGTNFALMTGPGGKSQVVERPQAGGGAPMAGGGAPMAGGAPAPTQAVSPAAIKQGQALQLKEGEAFVKFGSEDLQPKAEAGGQVSRIRKQQINGPDGILSNPELAGLLQGQGPTSTKILGILRDTITGNFKDGDELSRRVADLGLNQRQTDVLNIQIGLAKQVDPFTLKQNAGPGSVSDAEQKANRQANVDITRQGLYSGLTLMTRSQFNNDLAVARAEFAASHPDLNTTAKFNSAWNAEKSRLNKEYDAIYEERAKYIGQYNKDGKNPGAVVDAYKHYPVPEYDSENKTWTYGAYSDKARRPKLDSFVR